MTTRLLSALHEILGPAGLVTDPDELASISSFGEGKPMLPRALLRPASVDQVAAALAICNSHGHPVVPQGGLTGLAGGADAGADEIALSLVRFTGVEEIDAEASTITVRAGTILETAQEAARVRGFLMPVDLGARGTCQIGGVVATNAGGIRVIHHGTLRANVTGIEAVLADGTVLSHLNKAVKDNTGYALGQLFIGSEGTLGVITRIVMRLHPLPGQVRTALCALPSFSAVAPLLRRARESLALSAFELMWRDHLLFCGGRDLFSAPPSHVLLIEAKEEELESYLEDAFTDGLIENALVAQSAAQAQRFWDLRDIVRTERPTNHAINLDVSLPVSSMERFVTDCKTALADLDQAFDSIFFGHIGDGNLHALIIPTSHDPFLEEQVCAIAYGLVRDCGGSISAEHGIGRKKRRWLGYSRSEAEISVMRAVKAALDPRGILNPGKVI